MLLVVIFFTVTPVTLGISLFSLFSIKTSVLAKGTSQVDNVAVAPMSGVQVYASLPPELPAISATVGSSDARPELVKQYLEYYNSPLSPLADYIVQTEDKYQIDYRLLPAIAQQESNLCKVIPPNSYNCWGWGINSASNLGFSSYKEAIDAVAKGIKTDYIDQGYKTVSQIMYKYNPNSPGGAETKSVTQFMSDMEEPFGS